MGYQAQKYVQSFVYRLVNLNRRILAEFEKCGATHYNDYQFLKENSVAMWQSWKDFAGSGDITNLVIQHVGFPYAEGTVNVEHPYAVKVK